LNAHDDNSLFGDQNFITRLNGWIFESSKRINIYLSKMRSFGNPRFIVDAYPMAATLLFADRPITNTNPMKRIPSE
jgi:hypothetical protein